MIGAQVVIIKRLAMHLHLTAIQPHIFTIHPTACGTNRTFSNLDLVRECYYIPVSQQDTSNIATTKPFGLHKFFRMHSGLRSTCQTTQRLMDQVIRGLSFAFIYADDVLIACADKHKH